MARINIEESIYSDRRFLILVNKHGDFTALGMLVTAWRLAQKHYLSNEGYIPHAEWEAYGLGEIETVKLAERHERGIYVKGTAEQFSWLKQRSLAGFSRSKNNQKLDENSSNGRSTVVQRSCDGRSTVVPRSNEDISSKNELTAVVRSCDGRDTVVPRSCDGRDTGLIPLTLTLNSNTNSKYIADEVGLETVGGKKPKKKADEKPESEGSQVWKIYADEFQKKFGAQPLRNAKANALCKNLVAASGLEVAKSLVVAFFKDTDQFVIKNKYPLEFLIKNPNKYVGNSTKQSSRPQFYDGTTELL